LGRSGDGSDDDDDDSAAAVRARGAAATPAPAPLFPCRSDNAWVLSSIGSSSRVCAEVALDWGKRGTENTRTVFVTSASVVRRRRRQRASACFKWSNRCRMVWIITL
jgi:hypothetical protein